MTADDEVIRRLDLIQATLALAFAREIQAARDAIRADNVNAAVLDLLDTPEREWMASTALQEKVAAQVSMSTRRVRDRFPALIARQAIEVRGTGLRQEFRTTGLI